MKNAAKINFNPEDMLYPSNDCAPSVYTEFVNGIRFDICEVIPQCHNYINDKRYRVFLIVEERKIIGYEASEMWFSHSGETRWDFFCATRGECKEWIKKYEDNVEIVAKWNDRINRNPVFKMSLLPQIKKINDFCINRFGVKAG